MLHILSESLNRSLFIRIVYFAIADFKRSVFDIFDKMMSSRGGCFIWIGWLAGDGWLAVQPLIFKWICSKSFMDLPEN